MIKYLYLLFLLFASQVYAQDPSFQINVGLDDITINKEFSGTTETAFNEDYSYAIAYNREMISIWNVKDRVITKNLRVSELNNIDVIKYPNVKINKVHFTPSSDQLFYTVSLWNETTEAQEFWIIYYDYITHKELKRIKMDELYRDILYLNENALVLQQGGFFDSSLSIYTYDILTKEKLLIRDHYFNNGLRDLQWHRSNGSLFYTIIGNQKAGFFGLTNTVYYEDIAYPDGMDLETNLVASMMASSDNKFAIFSNSNNSFVTRLSDNKIVAKDIPTAILSKLPVAIHFNKTGDRFLYEVSPKDNSREKTIIAEFNLNTLTSEEIETISDDPQALFEFYYSSERLSASYDVQEVINYLSFKENCKALEVVAQTFGTYQNYWVSAFNGGNLGIYNLKNSFYEVLTALDLPKRKVFRITFYDQKILIAYTQGDSIELVEVSLQSKKITNRLIINNAYEIGGFQVSKDERELLLAVYRSEEGDEEQLILDLENFRLKRKHLLEDYYYEQMYLTNGGKLLACYSQKNGTYTYNSDTFTLVSKEEGLVVMHKDILYTIDFPTETSLTDEETYLENCGYCNDDYEIIDGNKVKITTPLNKVYISSGGKTKHVEIEASLSTFIFEKRSDLQIRQNKSAIAFLYNGHLVFKINVKTGKVTSFESELEREDFLILKDKKRSLLKGFGENNATVPSTVSKDWDGDQYGIDLYYSEESSPEKNTFFNARYTSIPFDKKYINANVVALINLGIDQYARTVDIEGMDENGFNGYITPTLIESVYLDEEEDAYYDEEEPDPYESALITLFDIQANKEYNLEINKNPFKQSLVFHTIGSRVFLSNSRLNRTQEISFDKGLQATIINKITPLHTDDIWQEIQKDSPYRAIKGENGIQGIYNIATEKRVASSYFGKDSNFFVATPESYYVANETIFDYIWFQEGGNIYRPEQYDVKYNRPDKILKALDMAPQTVVDAYQRAYQKRLKVLGVSESDFSDDRQVPEITITNKASIPLRTRNSEIRIDLQVKDSVYNLEKLQIWNNDVPVALKDLKQEKKPSQEGRLIIQNTLAAGKNKIQLSVLNEAGVESKKETLFIQKAGAMKKPNLYVLSLGISDYSNDNYDLEYAVKDATDIANTFEKSAAFSNVLTKILKNDEVTAASLLTESETFLQQATIDDVIIVFIASHGLLDASYNYYLAGSDTNFDNPLEGGIPYETINALLTETSSLKKIILMDACHSGEVDVDDIVGESRELESDSSINARGAKLLKRKKNLSDIAGYSQQLFSDLRRGNGTNVISSAGGLELAYEGVKWNNGLFTYALLDGLTSGKADLDNDGQVMLSELQKYTFGEVSKLSQGRQTPTYRIQNISVDYRLW